MELSTADLYSGQPYQRPVRDPVVDKLVREWDPRLLTPLTVSCRNGHYYLVDGQHRVCAMRKLNGGKDVMAVCQVYRNLTYPQEAELYYKLDRAKGHLRLAHATKALLESGSDAEILEINRLLGRLASFGRWTSPPGSRSRSKPPAPSSAPTICWAERLFPGCCC